MALDSRTVKRGAVRAGGGLLFAGLTTLLVWGMFEYVKSGSRSTMTSDTVSSAAMWTFLATTVIGLLAGAYAPDSWVDKITREKTQKPPELEK